MTHNKRLTDKLMDIARWYSMPADHFNVVKEAVKMLESAPSASCSENSNRCEDAISRQAVMDCFKKWQPYMATRLWDFEKELSTLPSVSTEKTGHWEKLSVGYGCSECSLCTNKHGIEFYRYCPNCGARMGVEE